jgi:hypothetical protein
MPTLFQDFRLPPLVVAFGVLRGVLGIARPVRQMAHGLLANLIIGLGYMAY